MGSYTRLSTGYTGPWPFPVSNRSRGIAIRNDSNSLDPANLEYRCVDCPVVVVLAASLERWLQSLGWGLSRPSRVRWNSDRVRPIVSFSGAYAFTRRWSVRRDRGSGIRLFRGRCRFPLSLGSILEDGFGASGFVVLPVVGS